MKKYTKPTVVIMPLEGTENLCGSCANKQVVISNPGTNQHIVDSLNQMYGGDDGVLDRQESAILFGTNESCTVEIESYCKFTAGETGGITVAFS